MKLIKNIAFILLSIIEFFEYKGYKDIDNLDKFTGEFGVDNIQVDTPKGWEPIRKVFKTKPFQIWILKLSNGEILECADEHLVLSKDELYTSEPEFKFVKRLNSGEFVYTSEGWKEIIEISRRKERREMFDLEIDSIEHSYYTNGILSHNTTTAAIFVAWYMIFNYEKHAIYVSKTYSDAKEVLNKTKGIIKNLPFFMKPGILNFNESKLFFDNECSITAVSTTKSAGVGHTLNLLYMDEFAHIPHGFVDDFYENAIPTLAQDPNSKLIITSTPKGYNKFYDIWKGATTEIDEKGLGINKFKGIKIDWAEVPGRTKQWRLDEIQRLGSIEAFNEQYGNQFLTSSKLLLESETIKRFVDNEVVYVNRELDLMEDYGFDKDYQILFHPDFDIDRLSEENEKFVLSFDVGEGTGEDYSAISGFVLGLMDEEELEQLGEYKTIYDIFKLTQVFKFTNNRIDPKEFAKFAYPLFMEVMNPENIKIVLEWNALGQSLYNSLYLVYPEKNDLYDQVFVMYKHRISDKVARVGLRYVSRDNKNFWALNFRDAAAKRRINVNEKETVEQFSFFGKTEKKGYHGQTGTDDLAMNAINAASILDTPEWYDLVDDYIDGLNEDEREFIENIIQRKLETYDEDSEESFIDLFSEEEGERDKYFDDF